jgi:hypothetical protein
MRARLLRRKAYGLDQKGDVSDRRDLNIEDTATPMPQHKTPVNKMNTTGDRDARSEFPWLGEHTTRSPSRERARVEKNIGWWTPNCGITLSGRIRNS